MHKLRDGCNITIGSRNNIVYRYVPRENDEVNSCWMCDFGRLNYKWINRKDRISVVLSKSANGAREEIDWTTALKEIANYLKNIKPGASAIIASARLSNEELWLLSKLKKLIGALSDSVPRFDKGDDFLLKPDRIQIQTAQF
jgi:NADH-quinone oxidoreductase subunit G